MAVVRRKAIDSRIEDLRCLSLTASIGVLAVGTAVVAVVVGPVAAMLGGAAGLAASAAAALACLAGAIPALIVARRLRGPAWAVPALLLGMTARMALPLALACLVLAPALANVGLLYYLLIFYPVTLTIETLLSIPSRRPESAASEAAQSVVG